MTIINQNKRVFVTSFDENYFAYSMVLAKTLAENYKGRNPIELICLVPKELMEREEEYIKTVDVEKRISIKFKFSDRYEELVSTGLYNFDKIPHITSNAMQRLFISSTLYDYDEIIYIDPDTYIASDIHPVLVYPMYNKFLAVQEISRQAFRSFADHHRPYFNNGVFITDLSYWREAGMEEKMIGYLKSPNVRKTDCIEQDVMNRFLIDVWSPLNYTFNYQFDYEDSLMYKGSKPIIYHYIGVHKPWYDTSDSEDYKWDVLWRKKFLEIFPNHSFSK